MHHLLLSSPKPACCIIQNFPPIPLTLRVRPYSSSAHFHPKLIEKFFVARLIQSLYSGLLLGLFTWVSYSVFYSGLLLGLFTRVVYSGCLLGLFTRVIYLGCLLGFLTRVSYSGSGSPCGNLGLLCGQITPQPRHVCPVLYDMHARTIQE